MYFTTLSKKRSRSRLNSQTQKPWKQEHPFFSRQTQEVEVLVAVVPLATQEALEVWILFSSQVDSQLLQVVPTNQVCLEQEVLTTSQACLDRAVCQALQEVFLETMPTQPAKQQECLELPVLLQQLTNQEGCLVQALANQLQVVVYLV